MKFLDLQIRTTDILHCIDSANFRPAIAEINEIKPEDSSGFADIEAKVTILYTALTALFTKQYFQKISDPRMKLMGNLIIDDEICSDEILHKKTDLSVYQRLLNSDDNLRHAQEQFATFLRAAPQLKPLYKERYKRRSFKFNESEEKSNAFFDIEHDVEQEEEKISQIKSNSSLGTSGLGPCVAIYVLGNNQKEKRFMNLGHYSSPNHETIQEMINTLIHEKNVNRNSMEVYLAGGSISTLTENALLLLNMDLNIMDVRLCLNNHTFAETSKVAIKGKSQFISHHTAFYPFKKITLPGNNASLYVPSAPGFFQSSSTSKKLKKRKFNEIERSRGQVP